MKTYVLHSDTLANQMGGPKTYDVITGETTQRVEGVATSADPDRYIARDGRVVAAGDAVKFVSSAQLNLERAQDEPNFPSPGF